MKKFYTHNKKLIISFAALLGLIIIIALLRASPRNDAIELPNTTALSVEVIELGRGQGNGESLNFVARVNASESTELSAESSGRVSSILVKEGDRVQKGQVIARLSNADQSIAYGQAKVQLENQELALLKMEKEYNKTDSSVQSSLTKQQELQVRNAYQNFLNTDLRAYPKEKPERQEGGAPIISGTYQGQEEGEYAIEIYPSGGESGASLRLSGLETGTYSVSTAYPVQIGSRGLYLQFPKDFNKNSSWVIPVPNTRSSQYVSARNAYEAAKAGKELSLGQSAITKEQLLQQKNVVRQQELALSQAGLQLEKTIIRAPFSGTLTSLTLSPGTMVSAFSPAGSIKTLEHLELEFSISNKERGLLRQGDQVFFKEKAIGEISYIASSLDNNSYKNKVKVSISEAEGLVEGETIDISVRPNEALDESLSKPSEETEGGTIIVPLSSLQIIGNDPFVVVVDENSKVARKPVVTGLLLGKDIEIREGLDGTETIIKDSRGLELGQVVDY